MGGLTTHVLDTARGKPARNVAVDLWRLVADGRRDSRLCAAKTNDDGRAALLSAAEFAAADYELDFHVGDYFRANDVAGGFLTVVTVRFRAEGDSHYHVPLLVSPYGYSTYRGS